MIQKRKRKKPRHIEHEHQVELFKWATMMSTRYPELKLMFAIPNESYGGGYRNIIMGRYFKMEGRKKGVPDIFLPVARHGYHGLFIEMKKPKHLKPVISKEQKEWIQALKEQGYRVEVCYGFLEASEVLKDYLSSN